MLSTPNGDPDSLHPEDAYSKRIERNNAYLWENPHTGHLIGINFLI
jgi:hypothetical protein